MLLKDYQKDDDGMFTDAAELREVLHTAVGLLYDMLESPAITGIPMKLVLPPDAYALLDAFIVEVHDGSCPHKKEIDEQIQKKKGKPTMAQPLTFKDEHVDLSPELEQQLRNLLDNI